MKLQTESVQRLLASRRSLLSELPFDHMRKSEAEGGCGVIGIACSERIPGRHLLQSLIQMRNRGNGKGGGVALVGLDPDDFSVTSKILRDDYALAISYLDPESKGEVERDFITSTFEVDHVFTFPIRSASTSDTPSPEVTIYFVRLRQDVLEAYRDEHNLNEIPEAILSDEIVYQNTFRLNLSFYASLGDKRAFVLSHGKDMLALKMVGYGDDVIHTYQLEDINAHIWIGHHRYPTKGKVWHPGGAHPFIGMHEALVHNGDFANYVSICSYLAQHNIRPLFLTDTEVAVLVFDLLHRTFGYPLEYVIEALAPTTERDFALLPQVKRDVYHLLQTVHMHGSPDGPWFFLIAQSADSGEHQRDARLVGITDTSMLRPQVFALQRGSPGYPSVGFAASEKQAIDAALESLSREDNRFWGRPDLVWNARGGSYSDGGAFIFSVHASNDGTKELRCQDKFGRIVDVDTESYPHYRDDARIKSAGSPVSLEGESQQIVKRVVLAMPIWTYRDLSSFLHALTMDLVEDFNRRRALDTLTHLIDRRYTIGSIRRSSLLSLCDEALWRVFDEIKVNPSSGFSYFENIEHVPSPVSGGQSVILDAQGFEPEGSRGLARAIQLIVERGFDHIIVANTKGHRFIANGLGPETHNVKMEVYGSSGDYLASGIDGAEVIVHGSGQDQLAQIMKDGKLVVYGDVGQTFMYAAKGGQAFVLGNAAGRPLINAVGKPRVVINGTCLDYLAESFMAGDPLNGGGFVILNGVNFAEAGQLQEMETPYPGGNLFSLASGGCIFVRDPHKKLGEDQLNGGRFSRFDERHWKLIEPLLEENERLFGIPISWLLEVGGKSRSPGEVYRVIVPIEKGVLQSEEAWVVQR